jgi:hypothetical protein
LCVPVLFVFFVAREGERERGRERREDILMCKMVYSSAPPEREKESD